MLSQTGIAVGKLKECPTFTPELGVMVGSDSPLPRWILLCCATAHVMHRPVSSWAGAKQFLSSYSADELLDLWESTTLTRKEYNEMVGRYMHSLEGATTAEMLWIECLQGIMADHKAIFEQQPNPGGGGCVEETLSTIKPARGVGADGRVTVVVTTSPTLSNPSTEMIEYVLSSFSLVPEMQNFAVVIVADGCVVGEKVKWKSGCILPEHHTNYQAYLDKLEKDVIPRVCPQAQMLRLANRVGFGWAVKAALEVVSTPYIMVVQHDYAFVKGLQLDPILAAMEQYPEVLKYVGFVSTTTLEYATRKGLQYENFDLRSDVVSINGMSFAKILFWYDKTHVCRTDFYRNFVFSRACGVRRGDFPEDRIGQRMIADLKQNGMSSHAKYGTYLWYPQEGRTIYIRHHHGRRFLTQQQRVQIEANYRSSGTQKCVNRSCLDDQWEEASEEEQEEDKS